MRLDTWVGIFGHVLRHVHGPVYSHLYRRLGSRVYRHMVRCVLRNVQRHARVWTCVLTRSEHMDEYVCARMAVCMNMHIDIHAATSMDMHMDVC